MNKIDVFYGTIQVLREVSLEIAKNEAVALLGPNAAGKSTTFKAIIGLLALRAGSIELGGEKLDGLMPNRILRKGVALVPEGRLIFPDMKVIENLQVGAYIHNGLKNVEDTLEWVYQLFPILKERSNQLGGSLSGGEQQMLAIGRALMSKPSLLLLDEPSQGLAPLVVEKVFKTLGEIREQGTSILVSEQNVKLALDFCNRGYILENGRIVMQDHSGNLKNNDHVKQIYLGL